jgi:hypothetical protein
LNSPDLREQWFSLLRAKYAKSPPDVVIPVHDLAATGSVENYKNCTN